MEEKVLYESKGCSSNMMIRFIVISIAFLVLGILLFCASGDGGKFTKEGENYMKIAGFVGIALSLFSISIICTLRSTWVKIYEDHIEGKAWAGLLRENKQFFCTTADILSYEVSNALPFPIVLKTPAGNHKIVCQDSEKACAALQTIIKNK